MFSFGKERREAVEIFRRFIHGEIDEESLLGLIRSLEVRSVGQIFDTLDIAGEDIRKIRLRAEDVARPIRDLLEGRLSLDAARRRIHGISEIVSAIESQAPAELRPSLADAMNLLSIILDPNAPLAPERIAEHLAAVLRSLDQRRSVPFRDVVRRILRDLGAFHFNLLCLSEFSREGLRTRLPWSDLALLYGAPASYDPRGDEIPEASIGPIWFIPLSVTTRRFYEEGLPARLARDVSEGAGWMHPRNCRVPRLLQIQPSLPISRYRPLYLIDPHGFAEIILDLPEMCRDSIAFAIQLFTLENGAREATLDGEPVPLLRAGDFGPGSRPN